jgi:hypothetical protein
MDPLPNTAMNKHAFAIWHAKEILDTIHNTIFEDIRYGYMEGGLHCHWK